jgi:diadenosine tetraphosphate (Ap4A) HIT family hydrolase
MTDPSSRTAPDAAWTLHPQLHADTAPVGDLPLSRVLSINEADYPWLILVPRRAGVVEIADLRDDTALLMDEIVQAAAVLKGVTGCDKINVGAIGNVVPQLHVHIVARRKDDPLWPKPIWGFAPPRPGDAGAFARFVAAIRAGLGLAA